MNYKATAARDGNWWAISITDGLPDDMIAHTQARRLTEVDAMTRSLIADLLELEGDQDHIEVELEIEAPAQIKDAVDQLARAEAIADKAASAATAARQHMAHIAIEECGLTMREAGQLLGVSHQRIKQLSDGWSRTA